MPDVQVAPGEVITAAHTNEILSQTIIPASSGALPTDLRHIGMAAYTTDTNELLIYSGAVVGWTKPWNMPWGILGVASTTTVQTGIGSGAADLTGLTLTFSTPANRRIRASTVVEFGPSTNLVASVAIKEGVGNLQTQAQVMASYATIALQYTASPTAGSHTWFLIAGTSTGTIDTVTSAPQPIQFVIEDLGPAGNPS